MCDKIKVYQEHSQSAGNNITQPMFYSFQDNLHLISSGPAQVKWPPSPWPQLSVANTCQW